jgi:hypothetical protein
VERRSRRSGCEENNRLPPRTWADLLDRQGAIVSESWPFQAARERLAQPDAPVRFGIGQNSISSVRTSLISVVIDPVEHG